MNGRPRLRHVAGAGLVAVIVAVSVPGVVADHGEEPFPHCQNPENIDFYDPASDDFADARGEEGVLVDLFDRFTTFSPASLVIDPGTCVMFENKDSLPHSVRILVDSHGHVRDDIEGVLSSGENVTTVFPDAGIHDANCGLHPTIMHGEITVAETSSPVASGVRIA